MHGLGLLALMGALSAAGIGAAVAESPPPAVPASTSASGPTDDKVAAFALQWFKQMQAGKIDRTQYTATYGAQLTDGAVQDMSRHLNQYGATPIGADVVRHRKIDEQTFYVVKVIFPRGDATGLLLGLDVAGKITGIDVVSLAGD
jgi:hypothetical protein